MKVKIKTSKGNMVAELFNDATVDWKSLVLFI